MSLTARITIMTVLVLTLGLGYLIFDYFSANEMSRRLRGDEPVGILLSFEDEADENLMAGAAQMIVYPEQKHILLYFLNTDASFEDEDKPTSELGSSSLDRFSRFSGVDNEYSINLTRTMVARLMDLMGGMDVFVEEPVVFDGGIFQYPQGIHHFSGDQIAEYMFARMKEEDPTKVHLTGVDRAFRMESILLSMMWNMKDLYVPVSEDSVWSVFASVPDTDLRADELRSLLRFIAAENIHTSAMEVPLEELQGERIRRGYYSKTLRVKENRARSIYLEFNNNLQGGRIGEGSFMLEVLNGTELNGLARRVKQNIQIHDIVVMDVDNYPYKPVSNTIILDRAGDTGYTENLMRLTGMNRSRVYFRRRPIGVDVTLILGQDFNIKKMKLY